MRAEDCTCRQTLWCNLSWLQPLALADTRAWGRPYADAFCLIRWPALVGSAEGCEMLALTADVYDIGCHRVNRDEGYWSPFALQVFDSSSKSQSTYSGAGSWRSCALRPVDSSLSVQSVDHTEDSAGFGGLQMVSGTYLPLTLFLRVGIRIRGSQFRLSASSQMSPSRLLLIPSPC